VEALHIVYDMAIQRFADLLGKDHPVQLMFFERYVKWQESQYIVPGTHTKNFEGLLEESASSPSCG
jgi:hypothetical protein